LKKKSFLNRFILLLALSAISGCVNSESSRSDNTLIANIKNDLDRDIVVIIYKMHNRDRTSEQYADWSANLNNFISANSDHYKVYESDKDFDTKYLRKYNKKTENYTLFIKKGKSGYFYNGVIVESMVYMAVNSAYFKSTLSSVDKAFLPDQLKINIK